MPSIKKGVTIVYSLMKQSIEEGEREIKGR